METFISFLLCAECNKIKPTTCFYKCNKNKKGFQYHCKSCSAVFRKKRTILKKEQQRNTQLQNLYGITQEEYEKLLLHQNGLCKICKTFKLHPKANFMVVDHDHYTNKLRGILCFKCNAGLGHFDDNVNKLTNAIKYLIVSNSA